MKKIKQGYKQTKIGIIPEDWNVAKVGEKFDFLKTYSNSREDLNNIDEISYIHYGEIHTKHKFYIDFEKFDLPRINKSKLPNEVTFAQNGDLVIADASEDYADIGKSAEIKNLTSKAVSGLHTFLLRDKSNNFADGYKGYLFYNETVTKNIKKIATGISVLGISKTNLSHLEIPLPPFKEQEKIAEILTTWDETISLHVKLIEKKEQFKIGLMQKLLSGEVRFDGFSDEWEEVRLEEIGNPFNGLSGKTGEDFGIGEAKYITYKNIFDYSRIKLDILENVKISNDEKQNLVQFGDIFFTVSSETPEEVGMSSVLLDNVSNTYLNSFCFGYRLNNFNTLDPYFARFYFRSFQMRDKISRLAQGSTRFNLSKNGIMKLKVKLPSLQVQQKIAEILSLADEGINLLKNELVELKLQKIALIQKLLTGQVRVKV